MMPPIFTDRAPEILLDAQLCELANYMTHMGARTAIICGLTGICDKRIRQIVKGLTGQELPRGPCQFPDAKYFAGRNRKRDPQTNFDSTRYIQIYMSLQRAFDRPLHNAWLVSAAYEAYTASCSSKPRLTINQVFALQRMFSRGELLLRTCDACRSQYLDLGWYESLETACPTCMQSCHMHFLAEVGKRGGRRTNAHVKERMYGSA